MILLLETIIEIDTKEVQEKYFKKYTCEGYYLNKIAILKFYFIVLVNIFILLGFLE